MKKYFAALSATALLSAAPYALAASTTDLTITGSITPVACTPSLSAGGLIDLGKISSRDLATDANTLVDTSSLELTMACDASTKFALEAIDNREGSGIGSGFGLGLTPDDEQLGFYSIKINNPTADGSPVVAIGSADGGITWAAQPDIQKGKLSSVGAVGTPTAQIPVEDVAMTLEVATYIARTDGLTLTSEVTIDGSATIEVKYM